MSTRQRVASAPSTARWSKVRASRTIGRIAIVSWPATARLVRAEFMRLREREFVLAAETMDEAIRYQFETRHDDAETGPCILAGPSCDSADVLYEKRPVQLPLALESGDKVRILCTGAYTSSYSSVGFNGFPPLASVFLN